MGERLFEKGNTVEDVITKIDSIVKKEFTILDTDDNDLEKWTSLPKLLLLDDVAKRRLVLFIDYMDSSEIDIIDKSLIVVSLSGLVSFKNIKLYDYDDGNLFLLSDYYQNSSFDAMKKSFDVFKNQELLFAVRKKTLDRDERKKILSGIEKKLIDDKIDTADLNATNEFIKKTINELDK